MTFAEGFLEQRMHAACLSRFALRTSFPFPTRPSGLHDALELREAHFFIVAHVRLRWTEFVALQSLFLALIY